MGIENLWTCILLALIAASYLLYKWGTRNFDFFVNQGIPGPKPTPFVGNLWGLWRTNFVTHDSDLAKKYGKIFGLFDGNVPNLFISDADLIRSVLVKDFEHFVNLRRFSVRAKYFRKMLLLIRDDEWKNVRAAFSPTFSTSKIKRMSEMIRECAEDLSDHLATVASGEEKFDAKKVFGIFTMDVITRCASGMKIDNLNKPDNPFTSNAVKVFNDSARKSPFGIIPLAFPKLRVWFSDFLIATKEFRFFVDLLDNVVKDRAKSGTKYNDFIDLATESMLQTGDQNGQSLTREEIDEIVIAQVSDALVASFEITAATLTGMFFLLTRNPDVQQRLYDEIKAKLETHNEVCHEMIVDFPYLDQVIHEVFRLYPPVARLERECSKDITYDGIRIRKGMIVSIPVYHVHYSKEYYENPEKFDPDRWAPENKHKLNLYTYMPFGLGPRSCIGVRFAMEELKIALCSFVNKLHFYPVKETPVELLLEEGLMSVIQPIDTILGVKERN